MIALRKGNTRLGRRRGLCDPPVVTEPDAIPAARARPGRRWRSVLFAPANRPQLIAKLPRSNPDVVVLDLEDAVPAAEKVGARALARSAAETLLALDDGPAVVVRVNAPSTEWFERDIAEASVPGLRAVIVPKLETPTEVVRAATALDAAGCPHVGILAGIETVRGVLDARELLGSPRVVACYFGAEDFTADAGGVRRDDNFDVAHPRAQVALAARLAGIAALDIVVTAFSDDDRFNREAAEARSLGYSGKLCIHPAQVPLANAAFVPSAGEVDRARRLLDAYDAAVADGRAAIAFEGQMVDEPLAARARAVLAAAES
jgi:citrate lyase subunit beta / citryl-CoA lyase